MPQLCSHHGCNTSASFGILIEGRKRPEFCAQHAKQGMVNVAHKKCTNQGCPKRASYGEEGSKRPEFCAQHAMQHMVDVINSKCANKGCTKQPTCGIEGSKKREYCVPHAKEGMVRLHNKCTHKGCAKGASYRKEGSRKPEFCAQHAKQAGMIHVGSSKKTRVNQQKKGSCNKSPSYGVEVSNTSDCGAQHALQGMVGTSRNKASTPQGCSKSPLFGVEGSESRGECCVQGVVDEAGVAHLDREGSLRVSCGGVERHRGSPPVNGTGSYVGTAGSKQGSSRKRAHGYDKPVAPGSVQAGSTKKTNRGGKGASAGRIGLVATAAAAADDDVAIPVLERDGLAVKSAVSGVKTATSGGVIEPPLFSPESGLTVKQGGNKKKKKVISA